MIVLLMQIPDIPVPDSYQTPVWIVTLSIVVKLFGIDKVMTSLWDEIVKPALVNNGKIRHKAAEQEIDNRVTLSNAMDSIGYHYYFLARRLVDVVFMLNLHDQKEQFVTEDYLRERLSSDIQRTKRLLASKHLRNGMSLSQHLDEFTSIEKNISNFYEPISKAVRGVTYESDLRDIVLKQVDCLYRDAEQFYQDNAELKIGKKEVA